MHACMQVLILHALLWRGQIPPFPNLYDCLSQKDHFSPNLLNSKILHFKPFLIVPTSLTRSYVDTPGPVPVEVVDAVVDSRVTLDKRS
jgi:hypothetical protein